MNKKQKARWLLFILPSIVLAGVGVYVIIKAPQIRGAAYIMWFIASWFAMIGSIIGRSDRGEDPKKMGVHKLTPKEQQKVAF